MEKLNLKCRKIKFLSKKNQMVVTVNSKHAKQYAFVLEEKKEVESYEVAKELDMVVCQQIDPIDIRKEYFSTEWTSDFVIHFVDGTTGIRELADESSLFKRSTIEKLEFSRRYWELLKIDNWKLVIVKEEK